MLIFLTSYCKSANWLRVNTTERSYCRICNLPLSSGVVAPITGCFLTEVVIELGVYRGSTTAEVIVGLGVDKIVVVVILTVTAGLEVVE